MHAVDVHSRRLAAAPSLLQDQMSEGLQALSEREQLDIAQALERVVEMLEMPLEDGPLLEAGPIIDTPSGVEAENPLRIPEPETES